MHSVKNERLFKKSNFQYKAFRWLLFVVIGLPIQQIINLLHVIAVPYFWFHARKRQWGVSPEAPPLRWSIDELKEYAKSDGLRNSVFLDNKDVHSALIHMYMWALKPKRFAHAGLTLLIRKDGGLRRKFPPDDWIPVSGDCLASWVRSYVEYGGNKEHLRKLAKHYLSNCMGLTSFNEDLVSSRSSNGGVNYVFDGWKNINQPAMGPQVLGSAALFCLAAKELGGLWHLVYLLHFWLMGQWLFALFPCLYPHWNPLYYTQHITILNASALFRLTKNPLYGLTCRWIIEAISPRCRINPLFGCWVPEILTTMEYQNCMFDLQRISHVWPQHWPGDGNWYNWDLDKQVFSVCAGAATLIEKHYRPQSEYGLL